MDEPLSILDAKLRVAMRAEIANFTSVLKQRPSMLLTIRQKQ